MKAVILAAGQGVRLKPLTDTRPKAMLQVAGKPILYHLLLQVKKAGIKEAVIVVRYMKEKIIDYFKHEDLGMKISFVEQGEEDGTGAALMAAEDKVNDTFLALAGDIITDAEMIKSVVNEHNAKQSEITLAVKKVSNPSEYGVLEVDSAKKVKRIEEKPKQPKSDLVNLSIYCMESGIFDKLKGIKKSARSEYELVDILIGAKVKVCDGFWMDVGYPWHLFDANAYLLSRMDGGTGDGNENIENSTIKGKVIMEKGAKVFDSFIEGASYIGAGTVIGPGAYLRGFNSFGRNCEIAGATTVKNSILFNNVNAKHLSYIGDSVIGENVNIASGTQFANFRFDEGYINVMTERGWVNSGRRKLGAIVGDNTKFGVNSCTMPGKLIGENCWIGSGATVNKNISPNTHVLVKQELSEYTERQKEE